VSGQTAQVLTVVGYPELTIWTFRPWMLKHCS